MSKQNIAVLAGILSPKPVVSQSTFAQLMEPGLEKLSFASKKVMSSRKAIGGKKNQKPTTVFECERDHVKEKNDINELMWFVLFDWLLNLLLSFKTPRNQLSKELERKMRLKSDISKRCICESKLLTKDCSTFEVNKAVTRKSLKICI